MVLQQRLAIGEVRASTADVGRDDLQLLVERGDLRAQLGDARLDLGDLLAHLGQQAR